MIEIIIPFIVIILSILGSISCLSLYNNGLQERSKWTYFGIISFLINICCFGVNSYYLYQNVYVTFQNKYSLNKVSYVNDSVYYDFNVTLESGKKITFKKYQGCAINKLINMIENQEYKTASIYNDENFDVVIIILDQVESIKIVESKNN